MQLMPVQAATAMHSTKKRLIFGHTVLFLHSSVMCSEM